ncbi:MAG: glycosyltransferase [Exilibacterium sp.]
MATQNDTNTKICVVIPCFNESAAINDVVRSFQKYLPEADIYVFDNNSTDNTIEEAIVAGAKIRSVSKQGKGNVVQAMFRDVDADIYVMVDGDGTYLASEVQNLLCAQRESSADMVVGNRLNTYTDSQSRVGHHLGNRLITQTVNYLFQSELQDVLSGYRVLTKRFVKSTPLFSTGFEVETAISIHAIEIDAKIVEVPISYQKRVEGSISKLNTIEDGVKIAWTIIKLFKDCKPTLIYGILSLCFFLSSLGVGIPIILEYLESGLVPRFPSAFLASALMILCFLSLFSGIIISSVSKARREIKKLAFLSLG